MEHTSLISGHSGRSGKRIALRGLVARLNVGSLAQFGALASAVLASTCCWLPLLLLAMGVSGGALSATFEAWRPVLLPITFLLLGVAFYFTHRKPKSVTPAIGRDVVLSIDGTGSCIVPSSGAHASNCCPPESTRSFTLKKMNKVMLWAVTVITLAFAFFPNYVGVLLSSGDALASGDDLTTVVVKIEGMTCEACAATIKKALLTVPEVTGAEVSYEKGEALIGISQDKEIPRATILSAISNAGYYGRFTDLVRWDLGIGGMTCQGCASHVETNLLKVPGIRAASISHQDGLGSVRADPTVDEEALKEAVRNAGYSVLSLRRK